MKPVDMSGTIVIYNLIVGLLIMLSSEKVASAAGYFNNSRRQTIVRLTHVSTYTFGAAVAFLSASIYVLFHILKVGL
jgi:hypothetical protein